MNLTTVDYDVGAVAMDKQGNIYLVGTHDGESSSDESYPLLVKYDSQGHIMLEALSRSLFASIDDPIGNGIGQLRSGGTRVAVSEKAIHVYPSGVTQIRPSMVTSKPAMSEARDIDSDRSPYRLGRHEQCLERRKEATSHRTGEARMAFTAHRASHWCP